MRRLQWGTRTGWVGLIVAGVGSCSVGLSLGTAGVDRWLLALGFLNAVLAGLCLGCLLYRRCVLQALDQAHAQALEGVAHRDVLEGE